jgi:MarR family transcriptional regulator, organic hydroperoxide resistance regulator
MKRDLEPFSSERLAHLVKHVFRLTSEMLQKRLKTHGVLYSHWTLLRVLWVGDGLTQRQLSDLAGISEPSTFMALKAMERKGYVLRQKMPDNNKQIRVFLTPEGLQLRQVMVPEAERINSLALAGLSAQDVHITRSTLLAMVDNLKRAQSHENAREVSKNSVHSCDGEDLGEPPKFLESHDANALVDSLDPVHPVHTVHTVHTVHPLPLLASSSPTSSSTSSTRALEVR